jgi:putative spermidine/putrescine transport system permease protein
VRRSRAVQRVFHAASAWTVPLIASAIYVFLVLPTILVVPMSFADKDELTFPPASYSLFLYRRFFASPVWTEALTESLIVACTTALCAIALGVPAAYGLVRGRFPGQRAIGFVLLSPILIPAIVIGLGIYLYFARLGLTGTTLGLVLAHTTLAVPFVIVTCSAGIRQVDVNAELAARTMGASEPLVLRRVILPQIVPSIISGALFAFLISFDEVVIAWFIAGTQSATLPVTMFGSIKMEVSPVIAASATLLSLASVLICAVSAFFQRPDRLVDRR